jgi:hypothetical protein
MVVINGGLEKERGGEEDRLKKENGGIENSPKQQGLDDAGRHGRNLWVTKDDSEREEQQIKGQHSVCNKPKGKSRWMKCALRVEGKEVRRVGVFVRQFGMVFVVRRPWFNGVSHGERRPEGSSTRRGTASLQGTQSEWCTFVSSG